MDKYEYNLKLEQMRQSVEKRDGAFASRIADEIDWKKEKDVSALIIGADAYEVNRQYDKAKELMLMAYEKAQKGRQLAYRLTMLSLKTKEINEAEEFYHDFIEIAPRDTAKYVLQYRISKAKGEPVQKQIEILEEYMDEDMEERWMYELAKLYSIAGMEERCVDLCDEMSLWFSTGKYVRKALDLKKKYKPLTKRQEENYYKTDADILEKPENEKALSDVAHKDASNKGEEKKQSSIPFTKVKSTDETAKDSKPKVADNEKKAETSDKDGKEEKEEKTEIASASIESDSDADKNKSEEKSEATEETQITENVESSQDKTETAAETAEETTGDKEDVIKDETPEPADEADDEKNEESASQRSIEDVLRNLEERGILKADTVNKTVETMDQAAEVASKAAEEATRKAEEMKAQETIIEDIQAKDLVGENEMDEVKSALESYADDEVNGFVFTDQIDSDIIDEALGNKKQDDGIVIEDEKPDEFGTTKPVEVNKTLKDGEGQVSSLEKMLLKLGQDKNANSENPVAEDVADKEPVAVEEPKADAVEEEKEPEKTDAKAEIPVETEKEKQHDEANKEKENPADVVNEEADETDLNIPSADEKSEKPQSEKEQTVELAGAVPILDLSFDAPVKKIHPGIAPTSEPVAANTASLKALFADLDEKTKKEIGIEQQNEEADENTEIETSAEDTKEQKKTTGMFTPDRFKASEADAVNPVSEEKNDHVKAETEKIEANPEEKQIKEPEKDETSKTKAAETTKADIVDNVADGSTKSLNLEKVLVTDEEMQPFESFKSVNGLEQKIRDTVASLVASYNATGKSQTGNIMILGDDKSGKTTMAIELIKLINKKRERIGRRIAKVDSSVLNAKGLRSSMTKLKGSDLIIENAQHLRKTVLDEIVSIGKYYTDNMLFVFEGETSALKTMRSENADIAAMFDQVLVIKEYDVKEWVAYAKKYANTQNYEVDEMGTLALYKAIDDFYGKHQGIDQSDVETIVNHAIKKANKKVTRKISNLFTGKKEETTLTTLKESDFK